MQMCARIDTKNGRYVGVGDLVKILDSHEVVRYKSVAGPESRLTRRPLRSMNLLANLELEIGSILGTI